MSITRGRRGGLHGPRQTREDAEAASHTDLSSRVPTPAPRRAPTPADVAGALGAVDSLRVPGGMCYVLEDGAGVVVSRTLSPWQVEEARRREGLRELEVEERLGYVPRAAVRYAEDLRRRDERELNLVGRIGDDAGALARRARTERALASTPEVEL